MPKIEVNKEYFFSMLKKQYNIEEFENKLTFAKAELDCSKEEYERSPEIKIELNDTNRPDLWSARGLARVMNLCDCLASSNRACYDEFLSTSESEKDCGQYVINVSSALQEVRPFIAGFLLKGKKLSAASLDAIIQTQEKLCTNYGKKRQILAMGVYRAQLINWPIRYMTEEPSFAFAPLGFDEDMSLSQILQKHPKGVEYASILKGCANYPILKDAKGEVLSFPPIINSQKIGAVEEGDDFLFVEFTGTQKNAVLLACNIVSCDAADAGWQVLPVRVKGEGNIGSCNCVSPSYFQKPVKAKLSYINRLLGSSFSLKEVILALEKMDSYSRIVDEDEIEVVIAPYRNDYLHPCDIAEDVMIASGLSSFEASSPQDFTIGRLLPCTQLARKVKQLLVGMGYEELIFNYLGSGDEYITKMRGKADNVLELVNPISESYQFVRPSILPSLLASEAASQTASYPHKIFEIGKIAYIDSCAENGNRTVDSLCFLTAEKTANYNNVASELASLLYYLGLEYEVEEASDNRFIKGRCALIKQGDVRLGIAGEINPLVLHNWAISMPCVAAELDLNEVMRIVYKNDATAS